MATLGTRIYSTVLVCFAWFGFALAFVTFWATDFSVTGDLAILLASGLVVAAVLAALWIHWLLGRSQA